MNDSPPRSQGNLADRDLPDLVQDLSRVRWTGVLVLGRMGVEVRLSFQDGGMVFASSSDPDSRLGTRLLRRGALTLRQLADAAKAIVPGKRLGTILVEQGSLVPKDLVRAVVDQTQEIIYGAFQWTEGEYRLDDGAGSSESITLNINTPSIILEGIRRIESWGRIERAVGGLDARYVRCSGQEATIRQMALEPEPVALLGLLEEVRDVEFLCARSGLPDFEACRTLWAFRVIGLIRRAEGSAPRPLDDDDGLEYVLSS
jgi:hypothetical protein